MVKRVVDAGALRARLEAVGAATYVLGKVSDLKCFVCLCCGWISYSEREIEDLYCAHCGLTHNKQEESHRESYTERETALWAKVMAWQEWGKNLNYLYNNSASTLVMMGCFADAPPMLEVKDIVALKDLGDVSSHNKLPPINESVIGLMANGETRIVIWDGGAWNFKYAPLSPYLAIGTIVVVRWRKIVWSQE